MHHLSVSFVIFKSRPSVDFDFYLRGNAYSFALITWELMNRTDFTGGINLNGETFDGSTKKTELIYKLAYEDILPGAPPMPDFKRVVYDEGNRPKINEKWSKHQTAEE